MIKKLRKYKYGTLRSITFAIEAANMRCPHRGIFEPKGIKARFNRYRRWVRVFVGAFKNMQYFHANLPTYLRSISDPAERNMFRVHPQRKENTYE